MSGVEAALAAFVAAVVMPVVSAATDPVVLFPVIITCLAVRSWVAYLVAPVVGIVAFAFSHSRFFATDGFESVMRFGWLFAAAGASLLIAFILRTFFRRFFAGGAA